MKKHVALLMAVWLAGALLLSACAGKREAEINVYNFGEYIDTGVLSAFEKESGIKVNYSTYETCEALYSVIKTGGASYDVVITSDYMISRLAQEGLLQELDFARVPHYSLISEEFKRPDYDPQEQYSVPYMWGTAGLIYNSSVVEGSPTTWGVMFDEKYAGNILMFESTRDAFMIALRMLGYDVNTTDEEQIREAYDLLKRQKPLVQAYVQDQIYDKLESGEAAIGAYYAGDYLIMRENNPDLVFVIPEEGSNRFVDAMVIPASSDKAEYAAQFIDYMSTTDTALANMEATGYASGNKEACELYAANLDETSLSVMFPDSDVLDRCQVYINLPSETLALYDSLWVKLKS